ncbi:adenine deaminase, partial [Candidatus Bipolaricaulota bacterium]|nr:adenine deaminase [Candidatus Bipolaricaulota bacterium]
IPLPIAGLMSEEPVETVAEQAEGLNRALMACGCTLNNAFMTFSLLALPVIPELRLSDLGLIDVESHTLVSLLADADNA